MELKAVNREWALYIAKNLFKGMAVDIIVKGKE